MSRSIQKLGPAKEGMAPAIAPLERAFVIKRRRVVFNDARSPWPPVRLTPRCQSNETPLRPPETNLISCQCGHAKRCLEPMPASELSPHHRMGGQIRPSQPGKRVSGAGEMADLVRTHDWSSTSLGPIDTWSDTLLCSVNLMSLLPVSCRHLLGAADGPVLQRRLPPAHGGKTPSRTRPGGARDAGRRPGTSSAHSLRLP